MYLINYLYVIYLSAIFNSIIIYINYKSTEDFVTLVLENELQLSKLPIGLFSGRSIFELNKVNTIRPRETRNERTDREIIRMLEMVPWTSCAYFVEARARTVTGKE